MSTNAAASHDESLAVCPQCCHANPPMHHFCEKCNAPLSSAAAILPSWRPWAEGALVRRAVREADSWLVLIGIWLIFLPPLLLPVLVTVGGSFDRSSWMDVVHEWKYGSPVVSLIAAIIHLLLLGGGFALFGSILFLTTRSFLRNRHLHQLQQSQE